MKKLITLLAVGSLVAASIAFAEEMPAPVAIDTTTVETTNQTDTTTVTEPTKVVKKRTVKKHHPKKKHCESHS